MHFISLVIGNYIITLLRKNNGYTHTFFVIQFHVCV